MGNKASSEQVIMAPGQAAAVEAMNASSNAPKVLFYEYFDPEQHENTPLLND